MSEINFVQREYDVNVDIVKVSKTFHNEKFELKEIHNIQNNECKLYRPITKNNTHIINLRMSDIMNIPENQIRRTNLQPYPRKFNKTHKSATVFQKIPKHTILQQYSRKSHKAHQNMRSCSRKPNRAHTNRLGYVRQNRLGYVRQNPR